MSNMSTGRRTTDDGRPGCGWALVVMVLDLLEAVGDVALPVAIVVVIVMLVVLGVR